MNDRNPLNIPEILHHVASFLTLEDLKNCIWVCKTWKERFIPLFWKDVTVLNEFKGILAPTVDNLRTNSIYVHSLHLKTRKLYDFAMTYPNLKSLECHAYEADYSYLPEYSVLPFIHLNPSLKSISISVNLRDSSGIVWKAISDLPLLTDLTLRYMNVKSWDSAAFWSACTKLESLTLTGSRINDDKDLDHHLVFPKLHTLCFSYDDASYLFDLLKLPHQYTVLKNLSVYCGNKWHESLECSDIDAENHRWPQLESLTLNVEFPSVHLSKIVKYTKPLTRLDITRDGFKPSFIEALRPHYETLVELSLYTRAHVSDRSLSRVFSLLPNLRTLRVEAIYAQDIVDGEPWVCLSLRTLKAHFVFSKDDQLLDPMIFERLSELVDLETLDTGKWRYNIEGRTLDFRLKSGLTKLSTLKKLRVLDLQNSKQELGAKEVKWMLKNWSKLKKVHGPLHIIKSKHLVHKNTFRSSNVACIE